MQEMDIPSKSGTARATGHPMHFHFSTMPEMGQKWGKLVSMGQFMPGAGTPP